MKKIYPYDRELLMAYLVREARDYKRYETREGQELYAAKVLHYIEEALRKYRGKADYINVYSHTNMGCVSRSLTLSSPSWGPCGNIVITLCTCGSLHCWGTVTFPSGKKAGRRGVEPI